MGRIDNDDDVKASKDSFEGSSSRNIKIPEDVRTPIYILDPNYEDGYVHYVKTGGKILRVVCAGGLEGKGFAPNVCKLCAYSLSLFQEAKKLLSKKPNASKKIKKEATDVRASYGAEFIAVKGELVVIKDKKTGERKTVPDFEGEGVEVGILTLTKKQFEDLTEIPGSEEYPYIKTKKDLVNRPIVFDKKKRDKSVYATTKFILAKKPSEAPDVEYNKDDFDISEDFTIDEDKVQEAYELLTGGSDYSEDDFEEGAYEETEDDVDDDLEEVSHHKSSNKNEKKQSASHLKKPQMDDLDDDFDVDDPEEEDGIPDFAKKDMGKNKNKKKQVQDSRSMHDKKRRR